MVIANHSPLYPIFPHCFPLILAYTGVNNKDKGRDNNTKGQKIGQYLFSLYKSSKKVKYFKLIFIDFYSYTFYNDSYIGNIVQIIQNILNKLKNYIDSNQNESESKPVQINKRKLRYIRFGFPTYSPRNTKDFESSNKR